MLEAPTVQQTPEALAASSLTWELPNKRMVGQLEGHPQKASQFMEAAMRGLMQQGNLESKSPTNTSSAAKLPTV